MPIRAQKEEKGERGGVPAREEWEGSCPPNRIVNLFIGSFRFGFLPSPVFSFFVSIAHFLRPLPTLRQPLKFFFIFLDCLLFRSIYEQYRPIVTRMLFIFLLGIFLLFLFSFFSSVFQFLLRFSPRCNEKLSNEIADFQEIFLYLKPFRILDTNFFFFWI